MLSTRATGARRDSLKIAARNAGSTVAVFKLRGSQPSSMHSRLMIASVMPAAPRVCPVQPLVELQGTVWPKTLATALSSALSFVREAVPCRLMY